jgi:peroxiredoxin
MYSVKFFALAVLLLLAGCGGIADDLSPTGQDERPQVVAGSTGTQVGQLSPDFTAVDTLYEAHALYTELGATDAVVLYFTMWCSVCDSHTSHLRSSIIPDFPNVTFFIVDFVNGTVAASREAQLSNGYASSTVLADTDWSLFNLYDASMGATVVIDSSGIVQMNEYYNNGVRLRTALEALP